jgi:hypothetical protein
MLRVNADVRATMPATHALRCVRWTHRDVACRELRIGEDACTGGDEEEPQLITERRESRVLIGRTLDLDFGLKRGANAARSRATSPRSASSASQSISAAGIAGSACQVEWNTDRGRSPGRYDQISSAVNDNTGASQRTIASAICHIAVWAERRARLRVGVVYSRSFSTSR